MKLSWGARRLTAARLGSGALGLIRPGAEAALLAGVAIGCAQIGWRIVSPEVPDTAFTEAQPVQTTEATRLRSPFAPLGFVEAAETHVDLSGIRVVGVRMAREPDQSGAVLIMGDGAQRSFLVGYEIANGVTLADVAADHIVVSLGEQEQSLMLERPQTRAPSLALALMGVPQQLPADQPTQVAFAGDGSAMAVSMPSAEPADAASWLVDTAGQVEMRAAKPFAWRAAAGMPAPFRKAGLQPGDLIISVNGAGPADGQARLLAAARGPMSLTVERYTGERVALSLPAGISP
jgi:general secretion pathway protein C